MSSFLSFISLSSGGFFWAGCVSTPGARMNPKPRPEAELDPTQRKGKGLGCVVVDVCAGFEGMGEERRWGDSILVGPGGRIGAAERLGRERRFGGVLRRWAACRDGNMRRG